MSRHTTNYFVLLGIAIAGIVVFSFLAPKTEPADNEPLPQVSAPPSPTATPPGKVSADFELTPRNATLRSSVTAYVPEAYLELVREEGWVDVPVNTVREDLGKPLFLWQKQNTSCVFGYALATNELWGNFKQTSFADKVSSADNQLWSSWYLHTSDVPQGLEFQWKGKQPFANEVRLIRHSVLPPANEFGSFFLYNKNGTSVEASCNDDVSNMLTSVKAKFNVGMVDRTKTGALFITSVANEQSLFFYDTKVGSIEKISALEISDWPRPHIRDNGLYYVKDGDLYFNDLFTLTETLKIDGQQTSPTDEINDFYFISNRIVYLAGTNCLGYMAKCALSLYEFDPSTAQSVKLADAVSSRLIAGYDHDSNSLRMTHIEGDAGCFWASTEVYNFSTRNLVKGLTFSECASEDGVHSEGYKAAKAGLDNFIMIPSLTSTTTDHIFIDRGRVLPPQKNLPLRQSVSSLIYDQP